MVAAAAPLAARLSKQHGRKARAGQPVRQLVNRIEYGEVSGASDYEIAVCETFSLCSHLPERIYRERPLAGNTSRPLLQFQATKRCASVQLSVLNSLS